MTSDVRRALRTATLEPDLPRYLQLQARQLGCEGSAASHVTAASAEFDGAFGAEAT